MQSIDRLAHVIRAMGVELRKRECLHLLQGCRPGERMPHVGHVFRVFASRFMRHAIGVKGRSRFQGSVEVGGPIDVGCEGVLAIFCANRIVWPPFPSGMNMPFSIRKFRSVNHLSYVC